MILDDLYFAGLFDGEGCIQIRKSTPKRSGSNSYQLAVTIAVIDRRPLEELKRLYDGQIYLSTPGVKTLSQAYQWVVVSRQAASFLEKMRPYSRVKREEIDVALKFQENIRRKHGGYYKTTPEEAAFRESCRLELKALKRRFRFRDHS